MLLAFSLLLVLLLLLPEGVELDFIEAGALLRFLCGVGLATVQGVEVLLCDLRVLGLVEDHFLDGFGGWLSGGVR